MDAQRNKGSTWWRWPLMPFAAFFGGALGALLFALVQWVGMKFTGGYGEDGWYFRYVMPVINAGIFGYAYAYIAYTVAPCKKFIAGVVMTTVLGVLGVLLVAFGWIHPDVDKGDAIQSTIAVAAWIFGACMALAIASDEHPE